MESEPKSPDDNQSLSSHHQSEISKSSKLKKQKTIKLKDEDPEEAKKKKDEKKDEMEKKKMKLLKTEVIRLKQENGDL